MVEEEEEEVGVELGGMILDGWGEEHMDPVLDTVGGGARFRWGRGGVVGFEEDGFGYSEYSTV